MSKIEWTDETWNPVVGCTRASAGCDNCYAVTMTKRLESMGQAKYAGLVNLGKNHFNGVVRTVEESLTIPLSWRKPRKVFVNSMSDLFHKDVPFEFIDKVFAVMALTPNHTYQILTKRPERMADFMLRWIVNDAGDGEWRNPLPNVWLGTSVENQEAADERIPHLLRCPAAVRFLSCEPLIGPIEFSDVTKRSDYLQQLGKKSMSGIHWVICGGESGAKARPMHPDWARSLRDQCQAAGVPFFFKQWGEYKDLGDAHALAEASIPPVGQIVNLAGGQGFHGEKPRRMAKVGKHRAGRMLNGRTWDEFPEVSRWSLSLQTST